MAVPNELMLRVPWVRGQPPVEFWVSRHVMIGQFIEKYGLKPTDMSEYQVAYEAEGRKADVAAQQGESSLVAKRPSFRGGMRMPHLHFKGEVYVLDEEQWKSFSEAVISDLKTKLASASSLSFDQLRDVAAGIDTLA